MATKLHRPLHIMTILVILLSLIGIVPVRAADNFFTVNSTDDAQDINRGDGICGDDAGDCTLRAALQEASFWTGATTRVELASGAVYSLTMADPEFTEAGLPIVGDITVIINGHESTIRRSTDAPNFHLFEIIGAADTLELNDVTLQNGRAPNDTGGAIKNAGKLIANNVSFENNLAATGGAIMNTVSATADIANSRFSDNSAVGTALNPGDGGAIRNAGTLTVTNTNFVNNTTDRFGGGIYNTNVLTVDGSTFSDNFAPSGGGGIYNDKELTVSNSTFTNNSANIGGSIYNDGTLDVTDTSFSGNAATSGNGGGIANFNALDINGGVFSQNTAVRGGAILNEPDATANLINSTFSINEALGGAAGPGNGGGILNDGTLTVTDSTFSGNLAGVSNATNGGSGGGIYNTGTLTFTNSRLVNNRANFTGGGGFYNTGNLAVKDSTISGNIAEEGGGIYNQNDSTLTVDSSTFSGNSGNNGGGIYNLGIADVTNSTFFNNLSFFGGGGIWNGGQTSDIRVLNSTFGSNLAETVGNGGIFSQNESFTIINSVLDNNQRGNCSDITIDIASPIADGGGNLSSDGSCPFGDGSTNNTDPLLGPLQDNGGPTQTMALLAGSPAIDAAITTTCPFTDQRGVARLDDGACDVGAYEATTNVLVVTNTNNDGEGSLRQVMAAANSFPNIDGAPDEITFDIPSEGGTQTISLTQPLPTITEPVIIDGTSQPGASCDAWPPTLLIELDGSAVTLGNGLTLGTGASGSTIRGLVINSFGANGLPYENGIELDSSSNNTIQCNFIGTSANGLTDRANGDDGIAVFGDSDNNLIGGPTPDQRNLISGNDGHGIDMAFGNASGNIVQSNYIGTNVQGNASLGNSGAGIVVNTNSNDSSITNNVITANDQNGIAISNSASGNTIRNNSIFENIGLGIDLGNDLGPDGPTANDVGDVDTGANQFQNYPNIAAAIPGGGKTVIDGRMDGEPNTTYTLDFYDNAACDPSGYGEGQTYLGSKTVTTNAKGSGYFTAKQGGAFEWNAALPMGHFVTATATDPAGNTSEFSQCTWVGPDNVIWPNALRLEYDTQFKASFDQYLAKEGEARWYKFSIAPEDRLTITLTNLPANYDITVYKDIAQVYQESLEAADPLEKAATEFTDAAMSPDRITDDYLAPDRITEESIAADVFSADVFSPDRITSELFSAEQVSSDVIAPDRITPDRITPDRITVEGFAASYISPDRITELANAQMRALIAVSAFEGTTSEGIRINTWTNTGDFYVRVLGRNGAFNTTQPFHIEVQRMPGVCADLDFDSIPQTSLTAASGNYKSLILSDFSRMSLTSAEATALESKIHALALRPEVAGAWVDVNADARVAEANYRADQHPECPYGKNVVAESIKSIVDRYRDLNPDLKYIVLIGNDNAIPFFRQPDLSLLGPESQYHPPVRDSSASQASLRLNYVLTQDTYGATTRVSFNSQQLPIPNLAVGRLVETPAEIVGAINSYLIRNGKALKPKSSLTTGYDFLSDAALAVKEQLDLGTGVTSHPKVPHAYSDRLISDPDLAPSATHETNPEASLEELPWTASQLSSSLEARRHDIVFLAGHFSAISTLAADFDTHYMSSDLLASSADLQDTIVFSAGCHSGYNVVYEDRILAGDVDTDWAQSFTRKGAILIAGTGYQYGDDDFVEYSERLYLEFSKQLRTGDDAVPIGDALVAAKQVYLANTPKMRGIHAKAYMEATLFNLPMITVDMPGERLPAPIATTTALASVHQALVLDDVNTLNGFESGPGQVLGLQYSDLPLTTTPTEQTKVLKNDSNPEDMIIATYFVGEDGALSNPAEPILPLQVEDVTGPSGLTLRGVGFRGGHYEDKLNITPLTGVATFELRGAHTLFNSSIFYPPQPWSVNYYDVLSHHGDTVLLNVTPAQFMSDAPDAHTGVMRVYKGMDFRLFYSGYTGEGANAAPPAILKVLSHAEGNQLSFRVTALSDIASGVQEVWITYMDLSASTGEWKPFDLEQDPAHPADWTGSLDGLAHPEDIRFIVQAVSGVGLVTLATNVGAYFIPDVDPAAPPPAPSANSLPTELAFVTPPIDGDYGSTATITALLTDGTSPIAGVPVSFTRGSQSVQVQTDGDGKATHEFLLDATPGVYAIRASFAGNETYRPSTSIEPLFTINKQRTDLTLQSITNDHIQGFAAKLVDAESDGLGQQTVVFVLHSITDPYTTLLVAFTDPAGMAIPDLTDVPAGQYSVDAYFGGEVPGYDEIDLSNLFYAPSTDSGTFEIRPLVPTLGTLDDFNRPNGVLGNQWQNRNFGSYRISSHQVEISAGGPLYWKAATFGANQAVQITLVHVDPNASRQSLLLKVQGESQPDWRQGAMAVIYDAKQHVLRLDTYQPNKSFKWTSYAATSFTLHDGDRLGAMVLDDGSVTIFVNGNVVATLTLTPADQAFFNSRGGFIGLWFTASKESVLDDFAGGTIFP